MGSVMGMEPSIPTCQHLPTTINTQLQESLSLAQETLGAAPSGTINIIQYIKTQTVFLRACQFNIPKFHETKKELI